MRRVAVAGTVAATMNLNVDPAASGPLVVIGEPVGWPDPLSAYSASPVMLNALPATLATLSANVSAPLPVLVSVCG